MYKVLVTKTFEKSFRKLKDNDVKSNLVSTIDILSKDPFNLTKKYNIKKLVNAQPGEWRIRIRDYRLRYDIIGKDVVLHIISHRKDVYKDLK